MRALIKKDIGIREIGKICSAGSGTCLNVGIGILFPDDPCRLSE
jgi:hypothetical protein